MRCYRYRMALFALILVMAAVAPAQAQETPVAGLPDEGELRPWLGRYEAGPEEVAVTWSDGPAFHVGLIEVPIDGRWHETVTTFSVRHRVTWDRQRERIRFEEQHNMGAHWLYEYALDGDGLVKIIPVGAQGNEHEVVKRRYRRSGSK